MLKTKFFLITGILIFLASSITAFAVSTAYWTENPLILPPGEKVQFKIILQNMAGDQDVSVKASITKGEEIVKIIDEEDSYEVLLGEKKDVLLEIKLPEETPFGTEDFIEISFTTIIKEEAETLGYGTSVKKKIPYKIEDIVLTSPGEGGFPWAVVIIITLVIGALVIILFVLKNKKERIENQTPTNFK